MALLSELVNSINGIVWGVPMIVLILGTGLYLHIRLRFMPLRRILHGFRMIWQGRATGAKADGEISPFAALMTALSAGLALLPLLFGVFELEPLPSVDEELPVPLFDPVWSVPPLPLETSFSPTLTLTVVTVPSKVAVSEAPASAVCALVSES